MLCGSLDGRGVWERLDTRICMAESVHCSSETITTLLINTRQYKKFFKRRQTMPKDEIFKKNEDIK